MKRIYLFFAILSSLSALSALNAESESLIDGRIFVSVDYLLMRMQQDGISYGTKFQAAGITSTSSSLVNTKQDDLYFPFKYESGFRATLGWECPCNLWGMKASYDYLRSSLNVQKVANGQFSLPTYSGTTLRPAFGNAANFSNISASAQRLESSWRSNFNQLDLFMDRKCESFRYLGLNFLLGLRLASINQHINSNYASSGTTTVGSTIFQQAQNQEDHLKTEFKGIGAMAGVQANWFIWHDLYIYGFLKGALLYSKTSFSLNSTEIQVLDGDAFTFYQSKKASNEPLKAALDLGVGLEYSISFCNEAYTLAIHTGWEHHQWFNQNAFRSALTNLQVADQQDQPFSGDFSYFGWVFGLDFLF